MYLFPPLHLILNKWADYPNDTSSHGTVSFLSRFMGKKKDEKTRQGDVLGDVVWTVINTAFFVLVFALGLLANLTKGNFTLIERFGVLAMYVFRAFSNAWVLALSERHYPAAHLEQFHIILPKEMHEEEERLLRKEDSTSGEGKKKKKTAKDLFDYLQSLSSYTAKVSWFGRSSSLHLTLISVLAAALPPAIILVLREKSLSIFESFLLLANLSIFFAVSVVLFRTFAQSFSLYQSMRSGMSRLIDSTKADSLNRTSVEEEKIHLDLTHPDNLRGYFYTHQVMLRREECLESKLVALVSLAMVLFGLSIVGVLAANSYFSQHENASMFRQSVSENSGDLFHQAVGRIISLDSADLIALFCIILQLFGALIALASLGSAYNNDSKKLQTDHLYHVRLAATIELNCDGWKEEKISKARKAQLETVVKLVDCIEKHIGKIEDMGIFGISYSSLYYYFVAFFSANFVALARKQLGV